MRQIILMMMPGKITTLSQNFITVILCSEGSNNIFKITKIAKSKTSFNEEAWLC